ncbi:hypothetical protein UMZ34_17405 [Halopseudomonas pachastrellae]|nr:hypothetical protein UMZ34_17405 [Halopseudomonas pachastrellae]
MASSSIRSTFNSALIFSRWFQSVYRTLSSTTVFYLGGQREQLVVGVAEIVFDGQLFENVVEP